MPCALEEIRSVLEELLELELDDPDLVGFGSQLVTAVMAPLDLSSLETLLTRSEPFARVVLKLVAPDRYKAMPPGKGLSYILSDKGLDIASDGTLGAKHPDSLLGKPHFAYQVGWTVYARNKGTHLARELTHRQQGELFESACVCLCFTVAEHRVALASVMLTLACKAHLLGLQKIAPRLQEPMELSALERAAPEEPWGLEPVAVEIVFARSFEEDLQEDDSLDNEPDDDAGATPHRMGPVPVLSLVRQVPRLVLLGGPGAGKTTTLRHLAASLAAERLACPTGDAPVPVLVQLSLYSKRPGNSLEELILRPLSTVFPNIRSLRETPLILLLDGMNEVHPEHLHYLRTELRELMAGQGPFRVVVTSRPGSYQDDFQCPTFELQPLTDELMTKWIQLRLGGLAPGFVSALRLQPRLWEWGRNPLNLVMLIAMGSAGGALNLENRGRLLQRFMNGIFRREEQQGRVTVDQHTRERVLASLGYETRLRGSVSFERLEAVRLVKGASDDLGAHLSAPVFVTESVDARILSQVSDERTLAFAHEMYQEYFAAQGLLDQTREGLQLLDVLALQPYWEEPIVLYTGLVEKRQEVLARMAPYAPVLVARCLNANLAEEVGVRTHAILCIQQGLESLAPEDQASRGKVIQALIEAGGFAQALEAMPPSAQLHRHFKAIADGLTSLDANRIGAFCLETARMEGPVLHVLQIAERALLDQRVVPDDPVILDGLLRLGAEGRAEVRRYIVSIFPIFPRELLVSMVESALESGQGEEVAWACRTWLGEALGAAIPAPRLVELAVVRRSFPILRAAWDGALQGKVGVVDPAAALDAALRISSYEASTWAYANLVKGQLKGATATAALQGLILGALSEGSRRAMFWAMQFSARHAKNNKAAFLGAITAAFKANGPLPRSCVKAILTHRSKPPYPPSFLIQLARGVGNMEAALLLERGFADQTSTKRPPTPDAIAYPHKSLQKEEKRQRISERLSGERFQVVLAQLLPGGAGVASSPLFPDGLDVPDLPSWAVQPGVLLEGQVEVRWSPESSKWVYALVGLQVMGEAPGGLELPDTPPLEEPPALEPVRATGYLLEDLLDPSERERIRRQLSDRQFQFDLMSCLPNGGGFATHPEFPANVFVDHLLPGLVAPGAVLEGRVEIRFAEKRKRWNFVLVDWEEVPGGDGTRPITPDTPSHHPRRRP